MMKAGAQEDHTDNIGPHSIKKVRHGRHTAS